MWTVLIISLQTTKSRTQTTLLTHLNAHPATIMAFHTTLTSTYKHTKQVALTDPCIFFKEKTTANLTINAVFSKDNPTLVTLVSFNPDNSSRHCNPSYHNKQHNLTYATHNTLDKNSDVCLIASFSPSH